MKELSLNGFNDSISTKLSDRRCLNYLPVVSDNGSLSRMSLFPTVGREKGRNIDPNTGTLAGTNINPALKVKSNTVQWVNSGVPSVCYVKDQQVNAIGDSIVAGRLLQDSSGNKPDGGRVRIAVSPSSMVVTMYDLDGPLDDEYRTQYTENNVFNFNINPTTLFDISDVAYYGGRFLYCSFRPTQPKVYYSSLTSPEVDTLDFISPDGNSGQLKGIEVFNNSLYVFGETRTYIYQVTQDTTLPFRFVGAIDVGLYQPESKVATGRGIYMIGKTSSANYGVYLISGGSYQKVSTERIDFRLSENDLYNTYDPGGAVFPDYIPTFKISDSDQEVIVFNAPNGCLCFSETTGMWHERKTDGRGDWDCIGYGLSTEGPVFISDTWLDNGDGTYDTNLSEPNRKSGLELGSLMVREMTSAPFNANNDRMVVSELEPMCEADYSEPVAGWVDTKVKLSMSYDFGNTFEAERGLSVGKVGEYNARTRFLSLGYVEQAFVVKISVVNPYPVRVLKLLSRTTKGYS